MLATGSTAQSWLEPAQRPEHISILINSVDRYNPQNLETLQVYLDQQVQQGFYDGLANLAALKLYQFNPTVYNQDVVINFLIKALLALPHPDFKLSLALLGEAPVSMDPSHISTKDKASTEGSTETPTLASVAQVPDSYLAGNITDPLIQRFSNLHLWLSNARFVQFWTALKSPEYAEVRAYTEKVPTFLSDARRIVLDTVALAFKRISAERLARYLDVDQAQLAKEVEQLAGWTLEGDQVIVPANADNEIKAVTANEQIELEQLHKLLVQAQPAPLSVSN